MVVFDKTNLKDGLPRGLFIPDLDLLPQRQSIGAIIALGVTFFLQRKTLNE